MKDILINASILSDHNTGLGVYTIQVLNHVIPLLDQNGVSYEIMCGDLNYLPEKMRGNALIVPFSGFMSRNIKTNTAYSKKKYKLAWSTTHHGAVFSGLNQIITIHDIIPILYPDGRKHQTTYYKYLLPRVIKNAKGVITVSNNTKRDIIKYYHHSIEDEDKVRVIYESVFPQKNTKADFAEISKKYGIKALQYLCITGIHYTYKNIQIVLQALSEYKDLLKYKVVIIGNDNNEYGKQLHDTVQELGIDGSIVFTGFVTDEEKNSILANAFSCIYPSLYEGFGLPVLEAMEAGAPVICSNHSSLPEVGGDAAIYFDPTSTKDLHDSIMRIQNDTTLRDRYISLGFENLKRFKWEIIADELLQYLTSFI